MEIDTSRDGFAEKGAVPATLDYEYVRQGLAHAAEQVQRGEVADWDAAEIKTLGREFLAARQREIER